MSYPISWLRRDDKGIGRFSELPVCDHIVGLLEYPIIVGEPDEAITFTAEVSLDQASGLRFGLAGQKKGF